jgi:uncharacterized protein involved in type VI secretion and phage assembly
MGAGDGRMNGIVVGVVTDLRDPERLGRVKVRYPNLADQQSDWARLVTLMAGPDRGVFFRPEVDDEVLVAYEQGDPRRPYVLGSVWSKADTPPSQSGRAEDNDWRFVRSRSGHVIKLNDKSGAETIEIVDKSGDNKIVVDTAKNRITISAGQVVTVEASTIELKGQAKVTVEAPDVELTASTSMTLKGGSSLTLQGGVVRIN